MDFKYEPGRIPIPALCRMQAQRMDGIIAGQQYGINAALARK